MTPLDRSRRLQTGLASLGVVGALGVSFAIGATTHTSHPGRAASRDTRRNAAREAGRTSGGTRTDGRHAQPRESASPRAPRRTHASVSAPQPSPPQATTSGS